MENARPPLNKIAFVIDNVIVDILHTDDRLAAIMLSEPKIIDVSNHVDESGNFVLMPGMKYNEDGTFSLDGLNE